MDNKLYLEHLFELLHNHHIYALKQRGKSDIEPIDYIEKVDEWYKQIFDYVEMFPPMGYVRAIKVYQNSSTIISDIEYLYCDEKESLNVISISIFWSD